MAHAFNFCWNPVPPSQVLLALFDAVDDTKIVGKAIVGELAEKLGPILESDTGRKVLLYLMCHR